MARLDRGHRPTWASGERRWGKTEPEALLACECRPTSRRARLSEPEGRKQKSRCYPGFPTPLLILPAMRDGYDRRRDGSGTSVTRTDRVNVGTSSDRPCRRSTCGRSPGCGAPCRHYVTAPAVSATSAPLSRSWKPCTSGSSGPEHDCGAPRRPTSRSRPPPLPRAAPGARSPGPLVSGVSLISCAPLRS